MEEEESESSRIKIRRKSQVIQLNSLNDSILENLN